MAKNTKNLKTPFLTTLWSQLWFRVLIFTGGTLAALLVIIALLNAFVFTPIKNPDYGASFSQKRAQELGIDWKANFQALLDDLQLRRFRLMSYWDLHEMERGEFDFESLDWQMDEAAKRGAKVSLGMGLRQPRWPECHQPAWADQLSGHEWKQALYAYMEIVAERYKNHPALDSWQLENEGMNNWFGTCDPPDRQRLIEEFALLKQWDPNHKIIMSLSDQHGLPLGKPVPDEYGFSVYRIIWNDKVPPAGYVTYPTPIWYHRLRAAVIKAMHNRPIMIHELQMEPWGPYDTSLLSIAEQDKSMSITQIPRVFKFARQLDIQRIDLWGAEWWYWRKINGDPRIWEVVRYQLNQNR
ncbi:MAG: beta-galactosidase [Candidatus Saccharimonadales bacterium]